jgi:diguanylate cyclase (GGDEF)-like protein
MELDLEGTLKAALASYRAALQAVSEAGAEAFPPAANDLKQRLLNLSERLATKPGPTLMIETEERLKEELKAWGKQAGDCYQEKTDEMKDLMLLVARAASDVGDRDRRYADKFGDLANRLQTAAKLNDLTAMRHSMTQNATDLTSCVANMSKDGQDSIAQLRSQLATYETRLEEVERLASVDQLTGVANRRKIEQQLERRVKKAQPFSVVYLDINNFKNVNDTMGHVFGDDLLRQFAGELRMAFRTTDLIGRWGGDEFIVLVDGSFREAEARHKRIEQWVNGEYTLSANGEPRKLVVTAAIGIAAWEPGETGTSLLHRADTAMYLCKGRNSDHPAAAR